MQRIQFILVSLFISFSLFSQHNIQSSVFDSKNGLPLELATVRLLSAKDSSLIAGCQTDSKGAFILNKVKNGNYIIGVSSVGYKEQFRNIAVDSKDLLLKAFQLLENIQLLKEVDVKGTAAQMTVKNDTLEYNATAFKTQEGAVVEDMIKKMPGIEISTDGKITVNGQEIKKVRVDGKKFFGDDIEMATKNIPADMIEKIQVYEQKSDMAQLTGFEDNDTERILNLTTKANRKHGIFGNVSAGIGSDVGNEDNKFRYDANAFLNIMHDDAQTAITAGGNNLNTTRSMRGRWGGAGQNSGITATQNIGINNNTTVNNKFKIGGDVSFNHSNNESLTQSTRDSYLKDLLYQNIDSLVSHNENYSANIRLEAEWKPDSVNTFVFQPNINYNRSFSDSYRDFLYLTQADSTSWGNNSSSGDGSSIDMGFNVIYNRKFAKKGRSLTANLQTSLSESNNNSYNYSLKNTPDTSAIVDQYTKSLSNKFSYSLKLSYVEPLWNAKNLLETAISFRSNINTSVKDQYNKDENDAYTLKDTTYSNIFGSNFYSETLELNYRYTEQNYNLMIGAKGEPSQTRSLRTYEDGVTKPYDTNVFNFSPTARFQYNFNKKQFARLDYRGRTDQPSITQMIPVKNNSNLMNETVGNPDLLPAFTHNFRFFYSNFNDKTFSSFNTMLSFDVTKDALVSNSIYDSTGKQYNQTVNADVTPYNIFGNLMFNTPIIQKRLHFNTATSGSYSMRYGYSSKGLDAASIDVDNLLRGDTSATRNWSANEQLSLTYTNDYVELGLKGSVRYSNTLNNLNSDLSETWDWTGSGNFVAHLPYQVNFSSDINYTTRSGYANFNKNALIWNASIDKTLFKGKGVLALKWNDILHQQLNIRQTIGDNYIQYSQYNTITSYVLLSFSYKINKFEGNKNQDAFENRNMRFGPGMRDGGNPDGGDRPPVRSGDGGGFNRQF